MFIKIYSLKYISSFYQQKKFKVNTLMHLYAKKKTSLVLHSQNLLILSYTTIYVYLLYLILHISNKCRALIQFVQLVMGYILRLQVPKTHPGSM